VQLGQALIDGARKRAEALLAELEVSKGRNGRANPDASGRLAVVEIGGSTRIGRRSVRQENGRFSGSLARTFKHRRTSPENPLRK